MSQTKTKPIFKITTVPASGEALAIMPSIKFASKVIDFYYALSQASNEAESECSDFVELPVSKTKELINFFTELKEELTKED